MLLIAHECPTAYIPLVSQYTTLDFAITHYALEDPVYTRMYANRQPWKALILDNGKFELGNPLAVELILKVANYLRADYVVPPDHFEDLGATMRSFDRLSRRKLSPRITLAPVCCGKTPQELAICHNYYIEKGVKVICWSFLGPRMEAIKLTKPDPQVMYHLLGWKGKDELAECFKALLPATRVSIDTSKPVAAAHEGIELSHQNGDVIRGKYRRPPLDTVYLDEKLLLSNIKAFQFWIQAAWDKRNASCEEKGG